MVETIAVVLLVFRIVSVAFIVAVLKKQYRLFRLEQEKRVEDFRFRMLLYGLVMLLSSVLPIIVDIYYAFLHPGSPFNILAWYAISNATFALVAALLTWSMHKVANRDTTEEGGYNGN